MTLGSSDGQPDCDAGAHHHVHLRSPGIFLFLSISFSLSVLSLSISLYYCMHLSQSKIINFVFLWIKRYLVNCSWNIKEIYATSDIVFLLQINGLSFMAFTLCLFLSLTHTLCLYSTLTHTLSLYLSLLHYVSISLTHTPLSLYLSLLHSVSISLSHSLCLSLLLRSNLKKKKTELLI